MSQVSVRIRAAAMALALSFALTGMVASCADRSARLQPGPASPGPSLPDPSERFLDDLQERTFRYFWDTANPENGLVPDRYPTPSFSSIAAVGFALTAYPIGIERGYVDRDTVRQRVRATLRFFRDAPQGPQARGVSGYKGFFYHFLDMNTGERFQSTELSTVDTALLLAGVLFCQSYFDGSHPDEVEIRELADAIYRRVDWRWAQPRAPAIVHGWSPESGFLAYDWGGYNEAMLVYLLALGSPTFAVDAQAWTAWTSGYERHWGTIHGQEHLGFGPHFGHQYTHAWVDFRGVQDDFMRGRGIDYFENSRRATYAQRAYAVANPGRWKGYGEDIWGLTACDGPANIELDIAGTPRVFRTYAARGIGGISSGGDGDNDNGDDDGTVAPTAAAASIAFAPEIVIPALVEMHTRYGAHIYSTYGFLDAFNLSFEPGPELDVALQHGQVIPGFGWVASDYLGIDQGPIVVMIENHRSDLVWRVMRKNPYLRQGLRRAGFAGGWLEAAP
jgi:hypothetical protein